MPPRVLAVWAKTLRGQQALKATVPPQTALGWFFVHNVIFNINTNLSSLGVIKLWLDKEKKARSCTKCSGTYKEI